MPFWRKRYSFYIPFIEKRYPAPHIPTLENCTPFLGPCIMKLMNDHLGGEYQALPEEMLSKRQVLFIQFTLWAGVKILQTSGAQKATAFVCDLHKTIPESSLSLYVNTFPSVYQPRRVFKLYYRTRTAR